MLPDVKNFTLEKEHIEILERAGLIPANTPPAQISVFAQSCREHGLSPFKKEIYLVNYGGKYSVIVGIDGMRAKAARTGQFAGRDNSMFNLKSDGTFQTAIELGKQMPETVTVTVYRMIGGVRCPFSKTVLFSEYAPPSRSNKWATMPINMIEKCCEAAALRMAFAEETAGLSIEEEATAIEGVTISSIQKAPEQNISPEDQERILEVGDILERMGFDDALKYFKEARQTQITPPLQALFFKALAAKANSVEDLNEIYLAGGELSNVVKNREFLTNRRKELSK